jgi:long-chain acyl-CoA synthetase
MYVPVNLDHCLIETDDDTSFSYRDLQDFEHEMALHIGPHKHLVVVLCQNNVETVFGYLSLFHLKCTSCLIDNALLLEKIQKVIELYQPSFLWAPVDTQIPDVDEVWRWKGYALYRVRQSFAYPIFQGLAVLLSTSGSTGSSKMVRLSFDNIVSNAASIAEYLHLTSDEKPITTLPLHYAYGLSILNSHVHVGAKILLTQASVLEQKFWAFFNKAQPTSLAGVPYTYELLEKLRFFLKKYPHLKTLTQAGGKLQPSLAASISSWAHQNGSKFFMMYGQTEATARISFLHPDVVTKKPESIGKAIPGGQLYLEKDELIYKGPNVMLGYAESWRDLEKGDDCLGVLRTGDLGFCDEDGDFFITGRIGRWVKLQGKRISLDQLEKELGEKGFKCYCGGKDSELKIAVENESDIPLISEIVASNFMINPRLFTLVYCPNIPRNSYGKVKYDELFTSL